SIGRADRLHQGAMPAATALFHGLSGGDEAQGRLADRLEILPLRSARLAHDPEKWIPVFRIVLQLSLCADLPRGRIPAAAPGPAPDPPPRHGRTQQPFWRRLQIGDLQERGRKPTVMARGMVQLADIPVDELDLRRAGTLDLRMAEVVPNGDVPGNIDHGLRCLEEAQGEIRITEA